jgi:peptide subunit release factor 1 (eRF1)
VTEALNALQGFKRILVAVVDRTHARFFEVTAFGAGELNSLILPTTRGGKFHSDRGDAPGFGEHDFHNRIQAERHRQAAAVADQLTRLAAEAPCQGVVLAGPLRSTSEMTRFLPRGLAPILIGIIPLNPTSVTVAEIREAALTLRAEHLKAEEAKLLGEVKDGLGTGWAVNGLGSTLRALDAGQVRTLVIPLGQSLSGWRCRVSGRLVLTPDECAGEGEAVVVPDLTGEVIEEAMRQRVEVTVLEDARLATQVDGMAALLRFR